jgi:hypothetical protein
MKRLSYLVLLTLLIFPTHLAQVQNRSGASAEQETPVERFRRLGGRETRAEVIVQRGELTTSDIAQERNLSVYDSGGHFNCRNWVTEQDRTEINCDVPVVRNFIWQHWRDRRRGYIRITFDSVDAVSTSHIFIEPDSNGNWHVAWRIVRHFGMVTDIPDIVSVERAIRRRNDRSGSYVLVFKGREGDVIQRI